MVAVDRPNRIYAEVEIVLLYLKGTRARAEAALTELRAKRGEAYAVEALERALEDMSETIERLGRDGPRLAPPA